MSISEVSPIPNDTIGTPNAYNSRTTITLFHCLIYHFSGQQNGFRGWQERLQAGESSGVGRNGGRLESLQQRSSLDASLNVVCRGQVWLQPFYMFDSRQDRPQKRQGCHKLARVFFGRGLERDRPPSGFDCG